MSEEGGEKRHYGTFHGENPHHSIGFPQPIPPPGVSAPTAPPFAPPYYSAANAYQAVPGYAVVEGRPVRQRRLPCCGIGIGWFLFIIGFFLAGIPWYVGAIILLCARVDYREKPGYVACTIGAIIAAIVTILGVTKGTDAW